MRRFEGKATTEPAANHEADAVMRGWALREAMPWLRARQDRHGLDDAFDVLNRTEPAIFILDISEGAISVRDKPSGQEVSESNISRAHSYRMYLELVVKQLPPDFSTTLAVFVDDGCLEDPKVPVFSFQKSFGNASMLLPDPDMMGRGFPTAHEKLRYEEKSCKAIFAGSTSGGDRLISSADILRDGAIPRIRQAEIFKGHPEVLFHLPVITQYDSETTATLLRSMGYGDEKYICFEEQLLNKFIISIDGNGATCTRVSITLSSNSVLLKYNSESNLYYFQGLAPWVHYVPITDAQDVLDIIRIEKAKPGRFSAVSVAARAFAEAFLTKEATVAYSAHLLTIYGDEIGPPALKREDDGRTEIGILAHISNVGDRRTYGTEWAGLGGSGCAIEGFTLWARGEIQAHQVTYAVRYADQSTSAAVQAGVFCGSSGKNKPLFGFSISLDGQARDRWMLRVRVGFIDGVELGPIVGGEVHISPRETAIERLSIEAVMIAEACVATR